jgi:hypothetical protein
MLENPSSQKVYLDNTLEIILLMKLEYLEPYMGYNTYAGLTGFGYCDIAAFGASGKEFLYPSTWVVI